MITIKELMEYLEDIPEDYVVKVTRDGFASDLHKDDLKYGLDHEQKEIVL